MTDRMSASDYRFVTAPAKRSKYGNTPTERHGLRFDSIAEADFHDALLLRQTAGEVSEIECQKRFAIPGADGSTVTTYIADFVFFDRVAERRRVVDVKGGKATQTDVFKLKAKLMRSQLGIEVEVEERRAKTRGRR